MDDPVYIHLMTSRRILAPLTQPPKTHQHHHADARNTQPTPVASRKFFEAQIIDHQDVVPPSMPRSSSDRSRRILVRSAGKITFVWASAKWPIFSIYFSDRFNLIASSPPGWTTAWPI